MAKIFRSDRSTLNLRGSYSFGFWYLYHHI